MNEKVHDAPIVHEATVLPTISHADFLKQKAGTGPMSHSDSGHKHQFYEGAPRVGGGKEGVTSNNAATAGTTGPASTVSHAPS